MIEYKVFESLVPEFVGLTEALDAELWEKNGASQQTYHGFNRLEGIHDIVLAFDGSKAVGCASFKEHETGRAEVKRVFVAPAYRGLGVSKGLMKHLETHAVGKGMTTFILETSRSFDAAVGLYTGLGYQVIPNYPPYEGMEASLCFAKKLPTRAPYQLATNRLLLRAWEESDAPALKALIDANLAHLRPWMPWAVQEPTDLAAKAALLRRFRSRFDAGEEFAFGIFRDNALVGACGLHRRGGPEMLEIGYWLEKAAEGQGLVSEATRALVEAAWTMGDIDRVEIHHDPRNLRSRRVPESLGFTCQSLRLRDNVTFPGEYRDSLVWVRYRHEGRMSHE